MLRSSPSSRSCLSGNPAQDRKRSRRIAPAAARAHGRDVVEEGVARLLPQESEAEQIARLVQEGIDRRVATLVQSGQLDLGRKGIVLTAEQAHAAQQQRRLGGLWDVKRRRERWLLSGNRPRRTRGGPR